ncbi:DNA replication/repair protein RecF [Thermophagus sp. OGC60D27]|uniref:DNA replication/repair protein RecF n=1 Tax=Thermophagus sp. OGC60D27 TaxID=3458415 RepID=UPI004037A6DC
MYLKHLNILNYKNISQADPEFCEGINCFVGANGAGKTNLLDTIYYLSFCKSFFNSIDSQNINHEEDFFVIQGTFERNEHEEQIYVALKRNKKKQFKRNKKEYNKLSEHIGLLPLVMISPSDERLITEGSDQRRKYVDSVVSQYNKLYLEQLIRYNRALMQRNALLKKHDQLNPGLIAQLDVWDEQLATLGEDIYRHRSQFIEQLVPVFRELYSHISGGNETVDITYVSHYQGGDIMEMLRNNRSRDLILGYTTHGIHKDDLSLMLSGRPVKKEGSQGQKKSFLIALKLAQYEFLSKHNGFAPILLLDDVFDKLDLERGNRLIQLVGEERFRQIFITDTQKERLEGIVRQTGKNNRFFEVREGVINRKNAEMEH